MVKSYENQIVNAMICIKEFSVLSAMWFEFTLAFSTFKWVSFHACHKTFTIFSIAYSFKGATIGNFVAENVWLTQLKSAYMRLKLDGSISAKKLFLVYLPMSAKQPAISVNKRTVKRILLFPANATSMTDSNGILLS